MKKQILLCVIFIGIVILSLSGCTKKENQSETEINEYSEIDIKTKQQISQAKTVLLPNIDSKVLMLDLASGELLNIQKADNEEGMGLAIEKVGKGDLVFDAPSLKLVRGATTQSLEDITEPFKTYQIGQNLPEILNVRTKDRIEYVIEVHSIDKDGCQLKYYPVHPKHYVSAVPLNALEHTLIEKLLEMVRQLEEKKPDRATYGNFRPELYHVNSQGEVTVWCYTKLRELTDNDCAEDEVGWGSSELVNAMGMYYLPDGTALQSRWRERGGGMKDIRVNIGRTVEESERVSLILRHDLPSDDDLLTRDGLKKKIMLGSWEEVPITTVVRIDRPLRLGSYYRGDIETDIEYFDDYDQITFSSPPERGNNLMVVTIVAPEGATIGQ